MSRHARGGRVRHCSPCEDERSSQLMSGARSTECNPCRFRVTLRRRPRPESNLPPASKRRSRTHVTGCSLDERRFILHMVSLGNIVIVRQILKLCYRYSARLALHDTRLMPQRALCLYHKLDKDGWTRLWWAVRFMNSGAYRP